MRTTFILCVIVFTLKDDQNKEIVLYTRVKQFYFFMNTWYKKLNDLLVKSQNQEKNAALYKENATIICLLLRGVA